MTDFLSTIFQNGRTRSHAPALISAPRVITYGDMIYFAAALQAWFKTMPFQPGQTFFANMADPDIRLMATLAAAYYGFIPIIAQEVGAREESGIDIVIGAADLLYDDVLCDYLIDEQVLAYAKGAGPASARPAPPGKDEIFIVGTSSGTTGRPKLISMTFDAVERTDAFTSGRFTADSRVALTIGDYSKYGLMITLAVLTAGGAIIRPKLEPEGTFAVLANYGATSVVGSPAALSQMLAFAASRNARLPDLREVELSGSLFTQTLVDQLAERSNAALRVSYGTAETGGIAGALIDLAGFEVGYVGEIMPRVENITAGTRAKPAPLSVRIRGGINDYVGSDRVEGDPSRSYELPDIGFIEDKRLYVTGRHDEVFNLSGNRVPFTDIEELLRRAGAVDVGLAIHSEPGHVALLVVGISGDGLTKDAALAQLYRLAPPEVIGHLVRVLQLQAIPRNANGKVLKNELLAACEAGTDRQTPPA